MQTRPKGSGSLRLKRKTLVLILRSALVARLHSYCDPSEDHPRRNCWPLKISSGAHTGAYYQLADANTEFLNVGTLLHSKIAKNPLLVYVRHHTLTSSQKPRVLFIIYQ